MMKKSLLLTIMLLSAVFGGTAWGQSTLTVCDGDATNNYVPVYYYWADTKETAAEFVIPATLITEMNGKEITAVTFYVQELTEAVESGATFKVYMKEVKETTVSSITGPDACSVVYTGTLDMAVGATSLNIEFDDSYGYGGENLLIGTYVETANSWSNATFLGIAESGASIIYANGESATQSFLPKTTFTYLSSPYIRPQGLTLDEVTTETAELSWTAPSGDVTGYKYQYKRTSASWDDDDETTSTSVSLSGLTAHTGYDFRVKAMYGENESVYTTTSFVTDCASTQSLPYNYGFEDADEFTCWTMADCGSNTKIKDTPHSGDYSFRFGYPDYPQYLISPKFDGTTGISLSFYYKSYDENFPETFQVGYSTTTDDPDDFEWHDEVTATNSGEWLFYNDNFPTGTKYIAVRYNSDDMYFLYADDFSFTEATPCPSPTNFAANNITRTTATITWTSDAENFDIQYKKLSSATWTSTTSTTNSCILEGLESETEYEVRVKAICGGEDGESDWSQSLQFITDYAIPVVINGSNRFYTDDFEGENLNWKFINGTLTNEWYWGTAANNGGSKAIYVSNDGGDHNTYTKDDPALVYATKTFTLSNTSYTISYDWKANGEPGISTDFDYLLVALVPASYVLTASNTTANPFYQGLPDGWISLTGNDRSMLSGSNVFQNLSVTVDVATAGDYKVVFAWRNDDQVTGNDAPAAIDNFSIEMVAKPTELAASPVVTSANITWDPSYENETAWLLYYSTSETGPDDDLYSGENVVTVNDNPAYTITGLTSEITYYVWVRSNFGTRTYSDWTGPVAFTPTAISAEVITNEGGNSNYYVPFDCTNVDNGTMSQFIVHATQLEDMVNEQIIKMSFYPDEVDVDLGDATFDVYLKEIENVRFETEEFMDWSEMTKVYEGSLSIANNKMEVVFNTPYAYSDKNLLVGFKLINTGTVRNVLWYGKSYFNQQYGVFSTDDMGHSYPEPQYAHFLPMVKFSCGYDYNIFETVGNWNDDNNWSKTTPSETQDVLIQKDVTIPTGYTANAASITLDGGSLTIEDGGQLICSNSVAATVKKSIADPTKDGDYGHWYTISTPVHKDATDNVVISETNLTSMGASNYDMFYLDETQGKWINQKTSGTGFSNMYVGQGYLYRNNGTDLVITGNTNFGDIEYTLTKDGSGDIAGFNLIGNPYPHDINLKHITYNSGSNLIGFYRLSNAGAWGSELGETEPIHSYEGFLVQSDEDDKVATFHETAQRGAKSNGDNIKFIVANSQYEDVAYALFDKGFGLSKINHRNAAIPMLYINHEDTDYAIATMSDDTKSFNLNFKAMTMGQYTLSYKANGNFSYLHVIDRLTGEDVDMLLEGEYSFIASPSDAENRFIVLLEYSAGSESPKSSVFAYQSGNDIIVNGEGELQIFDMMGRRVLTQYVSGVETINLQLNGVFIFRLNEKTQKIVVK